jgi:uncharacterized protein YutE (UPF0331/DUF86 family)
MLDKALIEHLDELEPLTTGTLEEYKSDAIKRHATEKLIELVVGYATDINQVIIKGAGHAMSQTY